MDVVQVVQRHKAELFKKLGHVQRNLALSRQALSEFMLTHGW